MAMPDAAAQVYLGRYRLVERLGAGGMAVVYKAIVEGPKGFSRPFVIKRILPSFSRDESFVNMLLTEARLSAMLRHPGIVQVHELGEADGEYYLAMEYVEGWDLSTLLRKAAQARKPIPPTVATYIMGELLAALAYAHSLCDEQGRPLEIVHRDVSPSNVMLTPAGAVKLLDFGIAKAASHGRDERTRTGTLKGKLSYLAPEQAEGLFVDRRSDIFALGIVFYEMLTMRRLFRGDDDFQTLRLVREAKVEAPSKIREQVPPQLDEVVLQMLARDAEIRYQTCDAALEALRPILHQIHGDSGSLKRYLQELGPIDRRAQPVDEADAPLHSSGGTRTRTSPSNHEIIASTLTRSSGEIRPITKPFAAPRRTGLWIGGGVAVFGLVVALVVMAGGSKKAVPIPPPIIEVQKATPAAVAPAPELPTPPVPSTPPLKKNVHVTVTSNEGGDVYLDGVKVGRVPREFDIPRGSGKHAIMVKQLGFLTYNEQVSSDDDTVVTSRMKRPPPAPRPVVRSTPAPAPATPPATRTPRVEIKDPFER
jgi:serine/threonine protein kinase